MALGEHESVTVRPVGLAGADPQLLEVQAHKEIHHRQRPADVAGLGLVDGLDHFPTGPLGQRVQVRHAPGMAVDCYGVVTAVCRHKALVSSVSSAVGIVYCLADSRST